MFIVVSYDISDDKRRTRLHKALKRFGEPVQLSVFECLIDEGKFAEMRKAVAEIVVEGDDLRYYDLCAQCQRQTITRGKAITTRLRSYYIV